MILPVDVIEASDPVQLAAPSVPRNAGSRQPMGGGVASGGRATGAGSEAGDGTRRMGPGPRLRPPAAGSSEGDFLRPVVVVVVVVGGDRLEVEEGVRR